MLYCALLNLFCELGKEISCVILPNIDHFSLKIDLIQ